jgi:tetratricopeptide (TPR) repeat protein
MEDPTLPAPRGGSSLFTVPDPRSSDPAVNAALNFQFARAESIFSERVKADPESPEGPYGLGLTGWWKLISGAPGGDPEIVQAHLERASKLSRDYVDRPGHRADAFFYSGRSQSLMAGLYLLQGKMMSSYRAAQRSRIYLEKCLKADPEYYDAYLRLGLYHYYSDALPKFFKFLGRFLGIKGDRELGLRELRMAAEQGDRVRGEATYFLANVLTNFEANPSAGMPVIHWLVKAYPENYVFYLEYQSALESLGYYPEVEDSLRAVLAPGGRLEGIEGAELLLGRNLYRQARYAEGAEVLEAAIASDRNRESPGLPWLYYFAARCRALMGDREAADRLYRATEGFKSGGNVSSLAEKRRKNPESESERRFRSARGLTRQWNRAEEAAAAWSSIVADLEAGRISTKRPIDQYRFRLGLCLEEAGQFDAALSAYARVGEEPLRSRARMGMARCQWRAGRIDAATDSLTVLSGDPDFPRPHLATRLVSMITSPPCANGGESLDLPPADDGMASVLYRDTEAWYVDVLAEEGDSLRRCATMNFDLGVWQARLPIAGDSGRYYYRVNGYRAEPDPLTRWEPVGRRVWSLAAAGPPGGERPEWSELHMQ